MAWPMTSGQSRAEQVAALRDMANRIEAGEGYGTTIERDIEYTPGPQRTRRKLHETIRVTISWNATQRHGGGHD